MTKNISTQLKHTRIYIQLTPVSYLAINLPTNRPSIMLVACGFVEGLVGHMEPSTTRRFFVFTTERFPAWTTLPRRAVPWWCQAARKKKQQDYSDIESRVAIVDVWKQDGACISKPLHAARNNEITREAMQNALQQNWCLWDSKWRRRLLMFWIEQYFEEFSERRLNLAHVPSLWSR